ncbi:MAG: adenosylhomocysteinase, partial [Thermoleophilia bacterium]|nr:adenosylhomocysteinase [Thermoleophilia bacterium]
IVTEVDPLRALEAAMDGFQVMPMAEAAKVGHVFCTATGNKHVLRKEHFELMRDGAVLANTGHFNVEIDIPALEGLATGTSEPRDHIREYQLSGDRKVFLLADGRLINLASAEGHPASVMDMSFANQALGLEWLLANRESLENDVYTVPAEIDAEIARLKLQSEGFEIDQLTAEQEKYLASWDEGT